MAKKVSNGLLQEINKNLGDIAFFTKRQLVKPYGIFGSIRAVHLALESGQIKSVKISARRTIIPRSEVLNFISRCLSDSASETP